MKMKNTASRVDVVFIRKSTGVQDEGGQIANVRAMLKEIGVYVPDKYWFVCTVSRAKVQGNADFQRLMGMVEAGQVGTVYVESQDRWGTGDVGELFSLLGKLHDHGTRLYDLRERTDLTGKDDTTEIKTFLGGLKSKKERQDLAYRSLRTRVQNFIDSGSWPTGTHPFGFGKACFSNGGKLLWVFQPTDRTFGQMFHGAADGTLVPGPAGVKIQRKAKGEIIKLVPSNDPEALRAVRLIYDLFTRVGLSRRAISARLNAEGLKINRKAFDQTDVTCVLTNPAYVGDTHFGKARSGAFHTFDSKGLIVQAPRQSARQDRDPTECLVRQDTHEALIDRRTWELAQRRLAAEQERTSFSPRNPAYYLKQLFVCGHCGKGLAGRTEVSPGLRKNRTVVYVCSTYADGRCNGKKVECGYQRITHDDAERLLLDKIKELNLPFEPLASDGARANIQARLARLGQEDEELTTRWDGWYRDGLDAIADYLNEHYEFDDYRTFQRLKRLASELYLHEEEPAEGRFARLPLTLGQLKMAVQDAEREAVEKARRELDRLKMEHRNMTLAWAKTGGRQQAVLQEEIDRLDKEMGEWEPRTEPLSKRLEALYAAEAACQEERERLQADWPQLDCREKGEAMRRLFSKVVLFWDRKFRPAQVNPPRPRKTDRPGRWSYTLRRDRIEWSLATLGLEGSW